MTEEFDNHLKAIEKTDTELRVANYMALFGGRDLSGFGVKNNPDGSLGFVLQPNEDGSLGEYFTKNTDFESDYTKTGFLHLDFEHGRDPDRIGNNKDNVLGFVDWKTARIDERGLFVERVLNRRKRYVKWLETLINAGLIGTSSEAVPGGVEKASNGEITRWALRRDTLTVTPMEKRMADTNVLAAIKALSEEFPSLTSLITDDTALSDPVNEKTTKGANIMEGKDEKDLNAEINKAVAEAVSKALEAQAAQEKAKAEEAAKLKAAEEAGYKKAIEEVKNRRAPAFNTLTTPGFSEEKDAVPAFKHWMSTGQWNEGLIRPTDAQMKASGDFYMGGSKAAWNVTTGASGAALVPDPLYSQIIAKRDNASWVRQAPCQYFQTSADHLLVPYEDTSHTNFVLTAEAAAYNENEGTVAQKDLILYKYTNLTKVNEEFLMYQATNWESWFVNAMGRAEASTENSIFTDGTGTSQPEGVVAGATDSGVTAATVDVITSPELTAFMGTLPGAYSSSTADCRLLMHNSTKWYLKGLVGNNFLYVPTPQGGDFHGYTAIVDDDVDAYTVNSGKTIIFGNFNFYGVVERPGMIVQRNPYLYMGTGQVGIFSSIFRGGGVLQSEAFVYFNNKSS